MALVRGITGFVLLMMYYLAWGQSEFEQKFESFTQGQEEKFNHFIKQNDRVFMKMLQQNWQEFQQMPPLVRDSVPKPKQAPLSASDEASTLVDSREFHPSSQIKIKNNQAKTAAMESIGFFGNKVELPQTQVVKLISKDQKGLYDFWKKNAGLDYSKLLAALSHYKTTLALSDWAYWLLVKTYSEKFRKNLHEQVALEWFLLTKSGYNVRVAFNTQSLLLLMSSQQTLYNTSYFNIQGERFYQLVAKNNGNIKTYRSDYNSMSSALDMRFNKTLNTKPVILYRHIDYKTKNKQHHLKLPYDYERVRYYSTYPQLDLVYYFKAPISMVAENGLRKSIPELLKGNKEKKINQLLHFIHKTFPYAVDKAQFGTENYLLLEETLHYQASDCEDRSVLFAWIATNILSEKVVMLEYPGHVSTAIDRNGKLMTADATYIGSKLGEVMPKYINVNPSKIIY